MPQMIRKKIKWPTKRRKCGSRVWKSRWIMVPQQTAKAAKPAEKKPEGEKKPAKAAAPAQA